MGGEVNGKSLFSITWENSKPGLLSCLKMNYENTKENHNFQTKQKTTTFIYERNLCQVSTKFEILFDQSQTTNCTVIYTNTCELTISVQLTLLYYTHF